MLTMDRLICEMGSQSSPNVKYPIRLRKDTEGHFWLSCSCKSWTTGRWQAGREIYERTCKHTDRTIIEYARELKALGYSLDQGSQEAVESVIELTTTPKEFTPVKTTRKIRA